MESVTSLAASLKVAIEREAKELEERRALLENEKELLAEEKRRMAGLAASPTDLVKVNVGGKVFQTQRSTLLSAEGTLLEAIFSGRWEESLARDEMGNVFLDFDPAPFRALLNYLRTRSLAEPGQAVPPPHVAVEHRAQLETIVSFMGLREMIYGGVQVLEDAVALSQAGCRDGSISMGAGRLQSTNAGHRCAVGGAPLLELGLQQTCAWKVSMVALADWVLAGVTASAAAPDNFQQDAGTFGWTPSGQVWNGESQAGAGAWPGWQTGDVAIFQLDAPSRLLRMHLRRTGAVYSLSLPPDLVQSARLYFNLRNVGNVVEVSQVTSQELFDVGLSRPTRMSHI